MNMVLNFLVICKSFQILFLLLVEKIMNMKLLRTINFDVWKS